MPDPATNGPAHLPGRLFVTGASGYIGRRFVELALADGFEVVAAVRRPKRRTAPGVGVAIFDLAQPDQARLELGGIDAVVHLGAILGLHSQPTGAPEDLNVSGTRHLLAAARQCGVRRFLFVSSQSAAPGSPTRYGRSKWAIEQLLDRRGEVAVRPGMVSGGRRRGLYGLLLGLARRHAVLPVVRPGAPLYPIHLDDLCQALLALVRAEEAPSGVIRVAPEEPIPFAGYLRLLARERLGRRVRLLTIPVAVAAGLARLVDRMPGASAGARERILGLIALPLMPPDPQPHPALRGLEVRPAQVVLAAEGARRRLLIEAAVLLRYVLGARPGPALMRRYVRAVRVAGGGPPLDFSSWWTRVSWILRFREPGPHGSGDLLRRRVVLATRVAEMTPEGALRFHRYPGSPLPVTLLAIFGILLLEALPMLTRRLRPWRRPGPSTPGES